MTKKNNHTFIKASLLTLFGSSAIVAHYLSKKKSFMDGNEYQRVKAFRKDRMTEADRHNDVTCSIVSHNSADDIAIVLESLSKQVPLSSIYVVDNASTDETLEIIREDFPEVNLIQSDTNLGFGAGHNEVIKLVDSKYHIIVNPDIQVDEDTVKKLAVFMEENPNIVCTTPRIHNIDGTEQQLPKRNPKIKYFLGGRLENKFNFASKWRAEYTRSDEALNDVTDIDFCSGCFMFIRTETLVKVGGFDERYFLYFEDADLTRMLQKKGRTVYYPKASVTHKWKRDNVKNKKIAKKALESMFKYFMKWGISA